MSCVKHNTRNHSLTEEFAHSFSFSCLSLARQPTFEGKVAKGRDYLLVDEFVGMGGISPAPRLVSRPIIQAQSSSKAKAVAGEL